MRQSVAIADNYAYLIELRSRLLRCCVVVGAVFTLFSFFAKSLYEVLAAPMMHQLPAHHGFIATQITAPFLVPFKFAFVAALFVCVPYLLYQLWQFIAPALYQNERTAAWMLLISSSLLFYLGVGFAYFIVFPMIFKFFLQFAPAGVELRPDIEHYLDFSLTLFLAFGAAFEVPVLTWVLVRTGITQKTQLKAARPYVIVAAFVIGMLLTPPDVISQVMLAVPIWFLFELGLLFA